MARGHLKASMAWFFSGPLFSALSVPPKHKTACRGPSVRLPAVRARRKRDSAYVSQYGQDAIVDKLLGHMTAGVFVDVGAYDGVTLSNTYFLETTRGWTGVCFEPNPATFEQLRAKRSCVCENVGVGP